MNGNPSWITTQIDAFATKRAIDRKRVWLAGWSGGASYIGLRAPELQPTFAALVYHGGGIRPAEAASPPEVRSPVYFMVGTANPLHLLAVGLRRYHESRGDEVYWNALAGADHAAEWKALEKNGGAVLDWLLTKKLR